jgi:uncharacterized protein
MPPEDRDRTDATEPPPIVGEWVDANSDPDAIPTVYPEPEPELDPVFCRRCGETSKPVANCCPWCGLWLVGPRPQAPPVYSPEDDVEPEDDWHTEVAREVYAVPVAVRPPFPPLVVVFVSYGLLILSLIGFAVLALAYGVSSMDEMYAVQAVVEVADAALVVIALALVWRAAKQQVPKGTMGWTWLAAFPVLAVLLCMGIAYTTFLRELLKPFINGPQIEMKVTWVTVLIICVQPAIVEELFFRQMTLGVFRRSMNLHLAVWLTAAMFAVAHLGNPLGMPYLFLVGGVLGYARVYGGLTLPMLMHFVHNFVVIAYEAWK